MASGCNGFTGVRGEGGCDFLSNQPASQRLLAYLHLISPHLLEGSEVSTMRDHGV